MSGEDFKLLYGLTQFQTLKSLKVTEEVLLNRDCGCHLFMWIASKGFCSFLAAMTISATSGCLKASVDPSVLITLILTRSNVIFGGGNV